MSLFSRLTGKDDKLATQVSERYVHVLQQTSQWTEEADRLRNAGKLGEARKGYEKSLNLIRALEEAQAGIVPPEFVQLSAMTLERIGDVEYMSGELDSAHDFLAQALERYQSSVGVSDSSVQVLGKLADVCETGQALDQARGYGEAAMAMAEQVDVAPQQRSVILNNLGRVYVMQGDTKRGLKTLEDAVAIDRSGGVDAMEAAVHLNNLGELYHMLGDLERAQKCLEEAAELQAKA
jgi:tetratricopeptide (TPR) repeat protein